MPVTSVVVVEVAVAVLVVAVAVGSCVAEMEPETTVHFLMLTHQHYPDFCCTLPVVITNREGDNAHPLITPILNYLELMAESTETWKGLQQKNVIFQILKAPTD